MYNLKHIPDNTLVEKYRESKNQKHLAILFDRYKPMIFGTCLKYFKNKEEAKDGCMDIYEKCISKLLNHKVDNFKSWLYVMTKNHCLEKLRKLKTHRIKENSAISMYSQEIFHPDNINDEILLVRLEKCIQKLSEEQKLCIQQFYFLKKSYQLISDTLDISWNRVRSSIQNARRNLKICIEQK